MGLLSHTFDMSGITLSFIQGLPSSELLTAAAGAVVQGPPPSPSPPSDPQPSGESRPHAEFPRPATLPAFPLEPAPMSKLLWACVSLRHVPGLLSSSGGTACGIQSPNGGNRAAPNIGIGSGIGSGSGTSRTSGRGGSGNDIQLLFERCAEHLVGRGGTAGFHAKETVRVTAAMAGSGIAEPPGLYAALSRAALKQRLELT